MSIRDIDQSRPANIAELGVLVLDDDQVIVDVVCQVLKVMGIGNIYRLTNPLKALDMIAEGLIGIDLIICDLIMPDADGLVVLRQVREVKPDLPFMMLTGDSTSQSVQGAMQSKVSAYVVKPFTVDALQKNITTLITRFYGKAAAERPATSDSVMWE